ncbi:hypothetical protein [Synechocystis sp. PCC 7509]|uniref:hypothetical protein n=1 Tax=Synechocystis sp. PCC 7509 TaxID=927677 RepID=UPI0002AC444B|nr:hypothetical protein [Synechocystis sp. PCC 7509]
MRNPEDVKSDLVQLIQDSKDVSPELASKLDEMSRWIVKKKSGLLRSKSHVMQLLQELIEDSTFWLSIQLLSEEDKSAELAELSTLEMYWYLQLFPAWFNEKDPKLHIWKENLMAGNFEGKDAAFINKVCSKLKNCGGETLNPFIADLSMSTDFIASGSQQIPLCVQITTVRDALSTDKQSQWQKTLKHWSIRRGIFISYNPSQIQVDVKIAQYALTHSDRLPEQCYHQLTIR